MTTAASTTDVAEPRAGSHSLAKEVAVVREGFAQGITRPLAWRRGQLTALDRLLAENGAAFEAAVKADLGKHPLETAMSEVSSVRTEIKLVLKKLKSWTAPRKVAAPIAFAPAKATIQREPLGTVLIIAPWNYPVNLLLLPVVGAIAAGNAVVMKPSELAPATSALLAQLVPQYLDARAITLIEGGVDETTQLLAERWDHIFYTGNGPVGKIVMAAAAEHLTPVTLELGGKSPVWVDPSADIDAAAHWLAWGKFLNNGQTCIAPDYVMTTPAVEERLVAALAREIQALYGANVRENPDYGRVVNVRHVDRIAALLEGATIAVGGQIDRDDRFIGPTVLTGVRPDDRVMQDEIFGPVLPVLAVKDAAAAIALVNKGEKPLAMYVFANAESVIDAFLSRTSSGAVVINALLIQMGVSGLPFGGVGASGMGSYHAEQSIRTFSHEKSILRKGKGLNVFKYAEPPFTPQKEKMLRR